MTENEESGMKEKKLTGYPSVDKPWLKFYSEETINAKMPSDSICAMNSSRERKKQYGG